MNVSLSAIAAFVVYPIVCYTVIFEPQLLTKTACKLGLLKAVWLYCQCDGETRIVRLRKDKKGRLYAKFYTSSPQTWINQDGTMDDKSPCRHVTESGFWPETSPRDTRG